MREQNWFLQVACDGDMYERVMAVKACYKSGLSLIVPLETIEDYFLSRVHYREALNKHELPGLNGTYTGPCGCSFHEGVRKKKPEVFVREASPYWEVVKRHLGVETWLASFRYQREAEEYCRLQQDKI